MQYLVYRQEGNLGPFTLEELQAQVAAGVVFPADLAWHEGLAEWEPVTNFLPAAVLPPASPVVSRASSPAVDAGQAEAERIRRKYLPHEANLRSVGLLYYLGGGLYLLVGICGLISLSAHPKISSLIVAIILLLLGGFLIWLARQFRTLSRNAVIPGTVVAAIGLLGIPIGTLISALILYWIHCQKGKVVFSRRYQDAIAATPEIACRTSLLVKIAFGVLLAVFALGIFAGLVAPLLKH